VPFVPDTTGFNDKFDERMEYKTIVGIAGSIGD
jgi:hypothetical protein